MGPQFCQLRIAAGHEPLIGVIGMGELKQIALVKQLRLQGLVFDEGADRATLECGNPVDAVLGLDLVNGLLRDHASIPNDHEAVDAEAVLQAMDLGHEGLRIGGITLVNRHGHRAATMIRQEPVIDLEQALLAVPVITELSQRTGRALEVTGGEVVESQTAFLQMPCRQFFLDLVLALQQPVHGLIEIIFIRIRHAEGFGERCRVPPASGCEFCMGGQNARCHHRQN